MKSVKRSRNDPVVRLQDTVRPLLLAPLGAVVVFAALGLAPGRGLPGLAFLIAMVWGYSLAAASVLVLPVLILAPRLRRPRLWVALPWGGRRGGRVRGSGDRDASPVRAVLDCRRRIRPAVCRRFSEDPDVHRIYNTPALKCPELSSPSHLGAVRYRAPPTACSRLEDRSRRQGVQSLA